MSVQPPWLRHTAQALIVPVTALAITGAAAVRVGAGALSPGASAHILQVSRQATTSPIASTGATPTPGPSGIKIAGGALVDAATGRILWSDNPNTERPIGSIVKVMTAMVVIEEGDLNQVITVPKSVIA